MLESLKVSLKLVAVDIPEKKGLTEVVRLIGAARIVNNGLLILIEFF